MPARRKYPDELWERAIRLVLDIQEETGNITAACRRIGRVQPVRRRRLLPQKSSYKLRSAIVVADVLDAKAAARLTPVTALLTSVATTPA